MLREVSPPDAVDAEVVEAMRLLLLRLGHGWGVRKLVEPLRRMLPHRIVRVRHVRLAMQLLAPAQFAARAAPTYQRRLRGTFVLPHANLNWQLDLDCKLQDFGIYIAGVIDAHDRTVLALIVLFDKTARSTWSMLRIGLASTGHWPEMLSTDHAEELKLMAFAALEARQRAAGLGFATGFYVYPPFRAMDSKRHIRIERLWGDVNPKAVFAPKEMLLRMESMGILNSIGGALIVDGTRFMYSSMFCASARKLRRSGRSTWMSFHSKESTCSVSARFGGNPGTRRLM